MHVSMYLILFLKNFAEICMIDKAGSTPKGGAAWKDKAAGSTCCTSDLSFGVKSCGTL
jgi:hypothetical protein